MRNLGDEVRRFLAKPVGSAHSAQPLLRGVMGRGVVVHSAISQIDAPGFTPEVASVVSVLYSGLSNS